MAGLRRICRHLIWIAFQTSFKCGLGLICNYYSHLALSCLSMLIMYVVTDRKLWLMVQRQSPPVQYQQAMVLVWNNVQKSGFVEHYDTTVKFTFDLLDLESSLHHCILELCVKLCHKFHMNSWVMVTFDHQILISSSLSPNGHLWQIWGNYLEAFLISRSQEGTDGQMDNP